ncbi:hypothetical protein [uncultured Chryseobacterium sp.]|uniref:hypothetical protein n=1 Tax=uncultured Chryseobacterium sp. TaxID=259322 RepID=UPI0025F09627|nr:hypothetical protein [uncultured Chryseobacterium sp.]
MKKILLQSLILLNITICSAQQQIVSQNYNVGGAQPIFYTLQSSSGKTLNYDDIMGSPYQNKSFLPAKISGSPNENVSVRYNNYKDEIEFKKNDEIFSLPKKAEYSRIEVISTRQIIVLLNISDETNGYFYELVKGNNSLYKKSKTKFIDFVPASNGYTSDKPASFKTMDPEYYINIKNKFIKPKNQKEIIEQFPDKKESLTSFFKSNKIKFDKEEDLIKLVNFLNQD